MAVPYASSTPAVHKRPKSHGVTSFDRAINTADRTLEQHDFSLRYLAPYRDAVKQHAAQLNLDEAWVYGLIRQESRFIVDAKSRVGASGLMQLMPATAQWVAKKLGLKDWRWSQVTEVDTNVSLGTWYLRHVLDTLDGQPVLASAAYNAGPGRARAWRSGTAIEGAIYAETIPFNETRDYVQKVMANATYYAHTLGHQVQTLKQRLNTIGRVRATRNRRWAPRPRAVHRRPQVPNGRRDSAIQAEVRTALMRRCRVSMCERRAPYHSFLVPRHRPSTSFSSPLQRDGYRARKSHHGDKYRRYSGRSGFVVSTSATRLRRRATAVRSRRAIASVRRSG